MTFKTVFAAEYQMSHYKEPVYQVLADTRLEAALVKGQTLKRSYTSDIAVNDMGGDGSYSVQAITDTEETLTINKEKEASIYIKDLDLLQAHLPVQRKYAQKMSNKLINQIDGDVLLAAYQGAGSTLDDGDFGGTSGNGFDVTASNVATVFAKAEQKLRKKNVLYNKRFQAGAGMKLEVPEGMSVAIITPELLTAINLYLGGKDTLLGDQVSRNGFEGYFHNFNIFVSNSLPWTATLGLATQPTDGDTVTINGVTFTFKTTLGSTAGNVLIGASNDTAITNLVALINAPGTTTAQGVALSAANQKLMKNITATADTTNNVMTLVASGWGVVETSETLTAAADVWTVGKEVVHNIFGLSKSVSLVVQKAPSMTVRPSPQARIGNDFIAWCVYGIKVFLDQQAMLVDFAQLSSSHTAATSTVN